MNPLTLFEVGSTHKVTLLTDARKTWGPISSQLYWRAKTSGRPRRVSLTLQGTIEKPFVWLNGHKGYFSSNDGLFWLEVVHSTGIERYPITHVDDIHVEGL